MKDGTVMRKATETEVVVVPVRGLALDERFPVALTVGVV